MPEVDSREATQKRMYGAVMGRVRNNGFNFGPTEELVTFAGSPAGEITDLWGTGREVGA